MSEGNTQTPAATPSEPAASPERAGASAPVDGGPPNGEATQPTDQAQPADGGEGGQPQEPGKGETPFHRTPQGRISHYQKETAREREARIRAEARADTLEQLLANGGSRKPEPAPAPAEPKGPPKESDYPQGKYDPDYAIAMAEYRIEQKLKSEREASATREREMAEQTAISEGLARLDDTIEQARGAPQGFENAENFLEFAKRQVPRTTTDLITTTENPIHVAEWFGRDPNRIRQVLAMPVVEQTRFITRLDLTISNNRAAAKTGAPANGAAQPTPAPRPAPQPQPAPIPTVTPSGAAPSKDPSKMSMAEFAAWRASGGGGPTG